MSKFIDLADSHGGVGEIIEWDGNLVKIVVPMSMTTNAQGVVIPTLTISERHEDGSIQIHDFCDARKASIILAVAHEVMWPPYEVVQDFVRKNDQGENLLGED